MLESISNTNINKEEIVEIKKLLETDVLTGLHNRYAYTEDLNAFYSIDNLPKNLVVFSVDINELKMINDTFGHLAGDELIRGASSCIKMVLDQYGKCYRTGGDEFIGFLYMDADKAYELRVKLMKAADAWHGELVHTLSVSVGVAAARDYPEVTLIEKLINIADEKMYEAKAQFYMQSGKKQRKNRIKHDEAIAKKEKEYIDIISAFASDVTGLYVIDRSKREVTAYRLSASDHRIRSGVPLQLGFETAMNQFINSKVHPDDRETMRQSIYQEFIERELTQKKSFLVHFRTMINGDINYHYMKCIKNRDDEAYDKIIISFCPEEMLAVSRRSQFSRMDDSARKNTILIVTDNADNLELCQKLRSDFHCMTVRSGKRAMEILKTNYAGISAIFYQQNMSDLSVSDFLKAIKDDVFVSSVPVVVIMSGESEAFVEEYLELGAEEFIRKPFHKSVIKHRVNNLIKVHKVYASLDEIEIDELTGLYTKQAFMYHAGTLLSENPDEEFMMVVVDVLNFKLFNSIYGMKKGDELLKLLAKLIRKMVTNGLCARYGSDQIISLAKAPKEDIAVFLNELQDKVNQRGFENVVLKFGVYDKVDHNLEVSRICDRTIQALQSIKYNYGRLYARFDGPVSQQQLRAQMFEARFSQAMKNHEFVVWYQPKYNPYTEKIVGAEALVRWQTVDGKLISPGEFLHVFEQDGLISQLDEYVFRRVCEQQRKWKKKGIPLIPISVNLSRNSMHHADIVKRYKAIVEQYEITPDSVPIEITESAAAETIEIKPLADAFYEAGFLLHMDDFGSGKSSIAGLNLLHFDTVKLDRSLIQFIGNKEGNLVIMYTVALGKELGLHLVAEGVETKEQIEYLKDIGCEGIQGFYYCKPVPLEDFELKVAQSIEQVEEHFDYRYKLTAADSMVKRAMDRMIQRMPGGFFTYRCDTGQILSSNSYLWNLFGCDSEEEFMTYVGGTFQGMVCQENLNEVLEYISQQIQDDVKEMDYVEYQIVRKDGVKVSVVDYGHLDHQPDGDIFYVFISEVN